MSSANQTRQSTAQFGNSVAHTWKNWSGGQQSQPTHYHQPTTVEDLCHLVGEHEKIRMVGAGHSFSPLVTTPDVLMSLDGLQGVITHDPVNCQATLWAGTRLYALDALLTPLNQALQNQGDIDQQSLAGAIATGTHGTGVDLPCLSALVSGFELVTADRQVLECNSQHNSEIFNLGRVALGSLGVMTKITLQNRPCYKLQEHVRLCAIHEVFAQIDSWKHQHRHIEFWAFLHADHVMLKTLDEVDSDLKPRSESFPSDDHLLTFFCEMSRVMPSTLPKVQKLLKHFVKPTQFVDWSSRIFPTPRNTKFNEMEYQLPVEHGIACLQEMIAALKRAKVAMFFPFEYRFVKGDDIALSPFYKRDSVSISVHQYYKQDHWEVFKIVEPILQKYQGRPHWGKLHTMQARQLRELYPLFDDFMDLRRRLDPQQKWLNSHLQQLFLD